MESYILTTAVNAGGNGQRYVFAGGVESAREAVESYRAEEKLLPVDNRDGGVFYVNPDHIVAVYPKEA